MKPYLSVKKNILLRQKNYGRPAYASDADEICSGEI